MQQYAQAAKGLIASLSKDLKELNLRLPDVLTSQVTGGQQQQTHPLQQQLQRRASADAGAPAAPAGARGSAALDERVARFKAELLASRIDLPRLRALAFSGIPDRDGLRAITWKVLLGYLPPDPSGWDELLARKRTQYLLFCEELIVDPKKKAAEIEAGGGNPLNVPLDRPGSSGGGGGGGSASGSSSSGAGAPEAGPLGGGGGGEDGGGGDPLSRAPRAPSPPRDASPLSADPERRERQQAARREAALLKLRGQDAADHPLALHNTSVWNTFFKDSEVMEQIDRDVMRTHPDMHFFSGDSEDAEQHRKEMKRALFLFAKLNPGLRYIQGMNELLAPLYYMFKTDTDRTSARYAEADSFYCFVELLGEFRDHFCQQLDNSTSGIKATIGRLVALLKAIDPQVAEHLEKNKVDPQFFAFRWITLLLTQEFPFPDAVRIWDTLLSDPAGRLDCLLRVCLALLLRAREQLLAGDFAANVKLLQRYPAVDVSEVLRDAAALPHCDDIVPPGALMARGGPL